MRYRHDALPRQFPGFEVVATAGEDHATPWGATQQFTALLLRQVTSSVSATPSA